MSLVRLTATGLDFAGHSREEWLEAGKQIGQVRGRLMWALGDWAVYGERRGYGDITALADEIGVSAKTISNAASVARAFPRETSRRREHLTFSHHAEVVALGEALQDRILNDAEAEGWTRERTRQAVNEAKNPPIPVKATISASEAYGDESMESRVKKARAKKSKEAVPKATDMMRRAREERAKDMPDPMPVLTPKDSGAVRQEATSSGKEDLGEKTRVRDQGSTLTVPNVDDVDTSEERVEQVGVATHDSEALSSDAEPDGGVSATPVKNPVLNYLLALMAIDPPTDIRKEDVRKAFFAGGRHMDAKFNRHVEAVGDIGRLIGIIESEDAERAA